MLRWDARLEGSPRSPQVSPTGIRIKVVEFGNSRGSTHYNHFNFILFKHFQLIYCFTQEIEQNDRSRLHELTTNAKARAIIFRPCADTGPNWSIEDVLLKEPREINWLFGMVPTGKYHTGLLRRPGSGGSPRAYEHEGWPFPWTKNLCSLLNLEYLVGTGVVEAVGPGVTVAVPGYFVILSFGYCGTCDQCSAWHPGYCQDFSTINSLQGNEVFASSDLTAIQELFIGQSCFASRSFVGKSSVTSVSKIIQTEELLKLYAPIGCGFCIGSASVVKLCDATTRLGNRVG